MPVSVPPTPPHPLKENQKYQIIWSTRVDLLNLITGSSNVDQSSNRISYIFMVWLSCYHHSENRENKCVCYLLNLFLSYISDFRLSKYAINPSTDECHVTAFQRECLCYQEHQMEDPRPSVNPFHDYTDRK